MNTARHAAGSTSEISTVGTELVSFWKDPFVRLEWPARLALFEDIDDEIRASTPDTVTAQAISRRVTQGLIDELDLGPVKCLEQAYLYLNSADRHQRESSLVWLILNGHEQTLDGTAAGDNVAGLEKRRASRYQVDLESIISNGNYQAGVKLVDISASGAKLAVSKPLPPGTRLDLEVPFFGKVAACVVWVAAAFVGLSFIFDQTGQMLS